MGPDADRRPKVLNYYPIGGFKLQRLAHAAAHIELYRSGPSTRTANTTVAEFHSPMALGALSPVRALLHGCYRQRELKLCAVFPV